MLITPTLFHCRMLGIWVGQFVDQCQSLGRNYISPMVTPWHYDCILVLLNLEAKVMQKLYKPYGDSLALWLHPYAFESRSQSIVEQYSLSSINVPPALCESTMWYISPSVMEDTCHHTLFRSSFWRWVGYQKNGKFSKNKCLLSQELYTPSFVITIS